MSTVYLSERANPLLKNYLVETGHTLKEVKKIPDVYEWVADHADIQMCKIGDRLFPATNLGYNYPENVKYNAACFGNYFVHNTEYTAPQLLQYAQEQNYTIIPVKQGYTKCNLVIVDDRSVITADAGIAKALAPYDIDVLTITTGAVKLAGFPYGFLGGASGRIGDSIVFHGDLSEHPDYIKISNFIFDRNLRLQYFDEFELEDIGSMIEVPS